MKDLIEVTNQTINNEVVQAVSARELHQFLEVQKQYTDWFRDNSKLFVINQDFTPKSVKQNTGHVRQDHIITVDMAKHLAMMSQVERGKQARKYFIECEKKLNQPQTSLEILQHAVNKLVAQEREQVRLAKEVEEVKERQRITEGKLEDFATGAEHFSITAYNKLFLQDSISNTQANADGRKISKLCKNQGIELGTAPHPVWGTINTYPKAMLDAYYHGELH